MKRLGADLEPPVQPGRLQARGGRGYGEAGPSPHIGMAEEAPQKTWPLSPILLRRGREPTTARGRAMDTFMIEKQLEGGAGDTRLSGQNQLGEAEEVGPGGPQAKP